jgi:hypothetical protein
VSVPAAIVGEQGFLAALGLTVEIGEIASKILKEQRRGLNGPRFLLGFSNYEFQTNDEPS